MPAKNGTSASEAGVQAAVAYGNYAQRGNFPYIATL